MAVHTGMHRTLENLSPGPEKWRKTMAKVNAVAALLVAATFVKVSLVGIISERT